MKIRKLLSMILIGATAVSLLAGCGSDTAGSQQNSTGNSAQSGVTEDTAQTQTEEESSVTEEVAQTEEESVVMEDTAQTEEQSGDASGNVLVVYFSATGNTEEVANVIAETTGGELFEIEPAEPYSDADLNWSDDNSRVSQEYANENLRDVELAADTVENWDSYDTVFIGYPIWWGIAAWPVDTFVEANDFTGKTVIPFCTSSSSEIGDSGSLLADLAGTGDWQEGMRFRSGSDAADVQAWVNGLGL